MILSTILFTSALGIAMPLLLSMVYGMLGGCDCCGATCDSPCLIAYEVGLSPAAVGCAAGTVTACVTAPLTDDFADPPWGEDGIGCGDLGQDAWLCGGTDCDTLIHDLGPTSDLSIDGGFAGAINLVQSYVSSSLWSKICLQINGPVSQFCVQWVADGVTSYVTYGPIAAEATYVLYPISGNMVQATFSNCGPCAP